MAKYLLLLLLYPAVGFSQQTTSLPNANCIYILTSESADKSVKQLINMLQDQGYFIENYNQELKSIKAYRIIGGFHSSKLWVQAYVRELLANKTRIQLLGYSETPDDGSVDYSEAKNEKSLLSLGDRNAFEKLNKLALQYPAGTVSYAIID